MERIYRHEEKFVINERQYTLLKQRLKTIMHPDPHLHNQESSYLIRTIYFDDYVKTSIVEKKNGLKDRYKYRIRFYNHDTSFIRLEKKVKIGIHGYKESIKLTESELNLLLAGNPSPLEKRDEPLATEFRQAMIARHLRAVLYLDYTREPYVLPYNDIRITFDREIRYTMRVSDYNDPLKHTQVSKKIVLEIKYNHFLPSHIKKMLYIDSVIQAPISKYVLCYLHATGEEVRL